MKYLITAILIVVLSSVANGQTVVPAVPRIAGPCLECPTPPVTVAVPVQPVVVYCPPPVPVYAPVYYTVPVYRRPCLFRPLTWRQPVYYRYPAYTYPFYNYGY
jgi:hypothetical protein